VGETQASRKSVLFLLRGGETVPSCRFRAYQFREPLKRLGVDAEFVILEKSRNPLRQFSFHLKLVPLLGRHDAVVFQKLLEPWRLRFLRFFNPNLWYDFDDAMYVGPGGANFADTVRAAPRVLAGNEILAARARAINPNVTVIPTTVFLPEEREPTEKESSAPVLSWIGTSGNLHYLKPVLEALDALRAEGVPFTLRILTERPERAPQRPWLHAMTWSRAREEEEFRDCDIGLMPLENSVWCEGKCACKALQYLSYGKPVIASPVGMNRTLFEGNPFGMVADAPKEWKRAIQTYLPNAALRRMAGNAGRAFVREYFETEKWAGILAATLLA